MIIAPEELYRENMAGIFQAGQNPLITIQLLR